MTFTWTAGLVPALPNRLPVLTMDATFFKLLTLQAKTLLSTDSYLCRVFDVSNGIISSYFSQALGSGCTTANHLLGTDVDHNAVTIQLMPYDDTPNPGGEYKVWVTLLSDYNTSARGNHFGFVASKSKTDNFKVASTMSPELDSRFIGRDGGFIDGLTITHTDPVGGSDVKWSYVNLPLDIHHEAHVEAVETGVHQIQIANQVGCTVGLVQVGGVTQGNGPMTVSIRVGNKTPITTFIDVNCK
jgi:hypothetical protein